MLLIVDNAAPNNGIVQGNCAPSLTDLGGRQGTIVTTMFDQFGYVDQENQLKNFVWERVDGSLVTALSIYLF
jgi:hypothetical protein